MAKSGVFLQILQHHTTVSTDLLKGDGALLEKFYQRWT